MRVPKYDIFSRRANKNHVWVRAAEGLGNAYELMTKIAAETPGPYFILCSRTNTICGSIDTSMPDGIKQRASA